MTYRTWSRLAVLVALGGGGLAEAAVPRLPESLSPGTRVKVSIRTDADGGLRADKIERRTDDDRDFELRGTVESIDPGSRQLTVLGFQVEVAADARLTREPDTPIALADIAVGTRVKVDGQPLDARRFLADKVRVRRAQYSEQKVVGAIEALTHEPATLELLGLRLRIDSGTEFVDFPDSPQRTRLRRPRAFDEDDIQFTGRNSLGRRVSYQGELRLRGSYGSDLDLDLDPTVDDRAVIPEVAGTVAFSFDLGHAWAYAEVVGHRETFFAGGPALGEEEEPGASRLGIGEAYVLFDSLPWRRLAVAVGRQKLHEPRKWLYSAKNLDAVRFFFDIERWSFEASLSRDLFDESRNQRDQETVNVILEARREIGSDYEIGAFFIQRDDRTDREDSPTIVALRALAEPGRHFELWADLAWEGGRRSRLDPLTLQRRVADVSAHAVDLGVQWRPRVRFDPSLTARFALGSGGGDSTASGVGLTGRDRTFRQSGLERNRDRWHGVVSFRYYGEVLDPELANLRVFTLAAGLRPTRALSFEAVLHRYRQDVASSRLISTDLEARPDGRDPWLGHEVDFVIGYEPSRRFELRLTGGVFLPGDTFGPDARAASVIRLQSKFRF